jgi:hypothetical protein
LDRTELAQAAPDGDPWRGGLAGDAVREQDPRTLASHA